MGVLVWLLLLFVAAVVSALAFGRNDGLVSFFWGGWRADLSLNLFVLLQLVLGLALVALIKAGSSLLSLPRRAAAWRAQRREQAAYASLREALAEHYGGRYGRAVKAAQRAVALGDEGYGDREALALAHMLAAGSLHRLQDTRRRDEQLDRLFQALRSPAAARRTDDGARLLAAEWALDDGHPARAVELLSALPAGAARRTQALRLRLRAARAAGQPLEALRVARLLAKHQAFSPEVARGLLRSLAAEALASAHDEERLRHVWRLLEDADRLDAQVAARAAMKASSLAAPALGRDWLEPLWKRLDDFDALDREALAQGLSEAVGDIGPAWLPLMEQALARHGRESAIALAAGMVFAERALWGKARPLLEQGAGAVELPGSWRRRAWLRLAAMASAEGDDARARRCERAAAMVDD